MKKKRQAIVHIGHKKTGTSFIQRHLHRNRAALHEQGVLYPMREANHSFALSGLFKQHNLAKAPSPLDHYLAAGDKARRALDAELAGSDWRQLVLSAESLCGFSRRELDGLNGWLGQHVATVQIIFVIRDPVDWAVSVAQQYLKTRGDVDAVLAEPDDVQWSKIIKRFRRVFGPDAVTVLEYEELATERAHFAARFARAVGLPPSLDAVLKSAEGGANESLSMEAALMLGRYNARVPQRIDDARNPARNGFEPRVFAGLPGQRFDLPQPARLKAYAQSRDDVAFVAREFGITRYSYGPGKVAPSRYTEAVSTAYLDALTDRVMEINAASHASRMLLDAQRCTLTGDADGAAAAIRAAAHRFPGDRRVARALAGLKPRGERD